MHKWELKRESLHCTFPLDIDVQSLHDPQMMLNAYLAANNLTDADFANQIGRDRTTVSRWRRGTTQPDWDGLEAVSKATSGLVSPNDFLTHSTPAPDTNPHESEAAE